jgi:class 3 adenylate cyclase/tetratricopeptide (TPR) repeat protein
MQCGQCRHENPAGQKFCGECGARLVLACAACQAPNPPTNKFCGECGASLAPGAPRAVPAAPTDARVDPPKDAAAAPPAPVAPTPPSHAERFGSPESYTPKHLAEKILTSKSAIEGERKQVTVVFTDVSGFTALSERLDPEEVHAIMDRAFGVIMAAVHGYEGTINQFLGDGVMALFGAPIAHEDHAGRALRAALTIQAELEPLRADVQRAHGRDFAMRIGVNTGPVVVGAIGRDLRMDYTAVGDTVNVAARLLNVAAPGQIAVSRRTKESCEGFFVFEDLGDFQVKGKTEPIRAYAVTQEVRGRTRLEVSKERGLTALVGRRAERERLAAAFSEARGGRGQVAAVAGEPGVGKSRLLYEFLQGLDDGGHLELEATCASYGGAMAYRPFVELYRRYFDLPEALAAEDTRARVAERLGALELSGDDPLWLLSHFLGLTVPPEFLLRVQGAQLRERTNALLRAVVLRESERAPVVVIVENVHWIDASSEDLLRSLANAVAEHRVLLVVTTRAATPLEWLPPGSDTIVLDGLDPGDVRQMVHAMLDAHAVSDPLFDLLRAKAEGNPLYVEEIVRQLIETGGVVVEKGEARLQAAGVTVPETIRDIIAARVDRLAESLKGTLQVASVVGRRFGVSLVSRVREDAREHVTQQLSALHTSDFVFPVTIDPELMYSFKHALTQDVVYASLLDRRRRQFHAAVGRGLEELYAERLGDVVELLAHHWERGGDDEKAVDYAILAAEKAQRRWANTEALALFDGALKRLSTMPDTEANRLRRIDAVVKQSEIMFALGRHAEQVQALDAIKDTVESVADLRRHAAWLYWAGFLHSLTGASPRVSIAYCRRASEIAETGGLADLRAFADCSLSHVYLAAGNLPGALVAGERALEVFEARGNVWWACRALWALSPVANGLGQWERGLEYCRRALEHGTALDDLRMKVVGWWRTGSTHIQRGDAAAGLACCDEANRLGPIAFDAAMVKAVRGYGLVKAGQVDDGMRELTEAVVWFEQSNLRYTRALFASWLAECRLRAGDGAGARPLVESLLETTRAEGYRHLEGVVLRLLGECCIGDDADRALAHLDAAMQIFEEVGARNEAAKTLIARGELRLAAGDMAGARTLLGHAGAMFEKLGTLDEPVRVRDLLSRAGRDRGRPTAGR